jgi:hypothetical protein
MFDPVLLLVDGRELLFSLRTLIPMLLRIILSYVQDSILVSNQTNLVCMYFNKCM